MAMLVTPAPAPGWAVARIRAENPGFVVAVTAADARVLHPWALFGSLTRLSPDGIVVWIATLGRNRPSFPVRTAWPPRLASFRVDRGWDLDVRVYFATQAPSRALRAKAQAELRGLQLPP